MGISSIVFGNGVDCDILGVSIMTIMGATDLTFIWIIIINEGKFCTGGPDFIAY